MRRGNEGGMSRPEQKDFSGETPELNAVLGLITKRLDQGVTFDKVQNVLKKYHKAEEIIEMATYLNDLFPNFENKHIPKELTRTEEESKIKIKIWEMRVRKYI